MHRRPTLEASTEGVMGSLTIRNLDDALKASLRLRAARHGRSMEEEARVILRGALGPEPPKPGESFGEMVRAIVEEVGGIDIELPPREPMRDPPDFSR
jgi:plasmid stability protein